MLTTTVCAALSAAGLAVAFLTAYRRRFAAATRIAAFALVPIGLAMAGLADLAGTIGRGVGEWAADLVFKPTVWAGFGVLAVSVVLYLAGRAAASRSGAGGSRRTRKERKAAARAEREGISEPKASGPALGAGRSGEEAGRGKGATGGDQDDFSDIEAILKKHGI